MLSSSRPLTNGPKAEIFMKACRLLVLGWNAGTVWIKLQICSYPETPTQQSLEHALLMIWQLKAMFTRKTVFQVRNLSSASDNGSNKIWLRKLRIIAKSNLGKTFFGLSASDLKLSMSLLRKMFSLKFSFVWNLRKSAIAALYPSIVLGQDFFI